MNERMKRDVLAILADLDSGANGGDVGPTDSLRLLSGDTDWTALAAEIERDMEPVRRSCESLAAEQRRSEETPLFPVISAGVWLFPLAFWTALVLGLYSLIRWWRL